MKRYLVLDLETVPDEDLVQAVDGEPSRPYAEQVRRLLDERRARSQGRSDFLPLPYHRPVVACAIEAVEKDGACAIADLSVWTDRDQSEGELLSRLWSRLDSSVLVTFRGRGFDLPVLELRAIKLGIALPGGLSRGTEAHVDLADRLSNGGDAPLAPLDLYAKLIGLPGKESIAGKDVQALYSDGALDRIAAYCVTDVLQTYLLHLRILLVGGSLTREGYLRSVESARQRLPVLFSERLGQSEQKFLEGFLDRCAPFFDQSSQPGRRPSTRIVNPHRRKATV